MGSLLEGLPLVLPAGVPSVAALAQAIRWLRWRRAGGRPDASGWDSRYVMLALLAGIGIVACLICLALSIGVAIALSDTTEGWACSARNGTTCEILSPVRLARVQLVLLVVLDAWLLVRCPGTRKR